jgi:predicted Rossmann-fold nucleotide-binding protein
MDLYLSSSPAIAPSHSLVIVAGGGRDLLWLPAQIAAVLLARTSGQLVHGLLHGGARHGRAAGPIRNRELLELAISRAEALSSAAAPVSVLVVALPGGAGTASLVREARRLAAHAPVPLSVAQISQAPTLT